MHVRNHKPHRPSAESAKASRTVRIWIDVEDLFAYGTANHRPSGIQRLAFELQKAMRARAGADRIRFLRHRHGSFCEVAWAEVDAVFRGIATHADATLRQPTQVTPITVSPARIALRRLLTRLQPPVRIALVAVARAQLAALRSQIEVLRRLPDIPRALFTRNPKPADQRPLVPLSDLAAPGDVLAILGASWSNPLYAEMLAQTRRSLGIRVLILVHDLIPIRHPEWCDPRLIWHFTNWIETILPETDIVLANSRFSARDVEAYAAHSGILLARPVGTIPIGTGFGVAATLPDATAPRPRDLPPAGSYVLFVSTIEARKNHTILFRAWRRLLSDLPPATIPTLVFAGRTGWLVNDLLQQLHNTQLLGGKIALIESPSDAELVHLYQGCLFTVFPSLYEGWGLPVTESHALGKPCIVSNVTSLPEAGGALARYFDPDDLNDVVRVIRDTLSDRPGLAEWEARVRRDFQPVSWDASAQSLLEHAGMVEPDP